VQIAILQLFARTDCLLPNVYVGTLTGKSVTEALERKITSDMIIKYLEDHRHPKVAHRVPVLPEAVKDQIRLWERELNRINFCEARMYESFESRAVYESCLKTAQSLGAVLHADDENKRLVVKDGAHAALREHILSVKQKR
jgi:transcription initiation factor TFIIH subunit 4